jgi:hypothetical protein
MGADGGSLVRCRAPSFAAGTSIETAAGPMALETLVVGDEVRTILGGSGCIVWIG